jgi:hypothetical protein
MAALKLVSPSPADQARAHHEQARNLMRSAVVDGLADIDALVRKIDATLALDIDKPGIRQAFERVKRTLQSESTQIASLLERP